MFSVRFTWRVKLFTRLDLELKTRLREAAEAEERENYERRFPPAWIEDLAPLGIDLDPTRNDHRAAEPFCITTEQSRTAGWVIPTNEELEIADQTKRLLESACGHETGAR